MDRALRRASTDYVFRLFVLDVETLGLTLGASPQQVEDAMGPHVIANG
jgi:phosphatidylethanolamine-binding protein (PEBP) family uncharacterized protein